MDRDASGMVELKSKSDGRTKVRREEVRVVTSAVLLELVLD